MVMPRLSLRRIRRRCGGKSTISQYSEKSPADGHSALPVKGLSARPAAALKNSTSVAACDLLYPLLSIVDERLPIMKWITLHGRYRKSGRRRCSALIPANPHLPPIVVQHSKNA